MGKKFEQITLANRIEIEHLLGRQKSKIEIANAITISLSGLYRELGRIPKGQKYTAEMAQADCTKKRQGKVMSDTLSRVTGLEVFLNHQLSVKKQSPEKIIDCINSGNAPVPPRCISLSTIYNLIRRGKIG